MMTREQRETVCLSIGAMDMAAAMLNRVSETGEAEAIALDFYCDELRQMLEDDNQALAMAPDQSAKLAALRDAVQENLNTIRRVANVIRLARPTLASQLDDAVESLAAALEDSAT